MYIICKVIQYNIPSKYYLLFRYGDMGHFDQVFIFGTFRSVLKTN